MRPGAAVYARVAYARELQGNLAGALQAMQMAREATAAHDPEAQAWYGAQVGDLYLRMGQLAEAEREYRRAAFVFSNHPFAMIGQRQGAGGARRSGRSAGDLPGPIRAHADAGPRRADRRPLRCKAATPPRLNATISWPKSSPDRRIAQTEADLALFLAEHDRKLPEAVADCRSRWRPSGTTSSRKTRLRGRITRQADSTMPSPPRSGRCGPARVTSESWHTPRRFGPRENRQPSAT